MQVPVPFAESQVPVRGAHRLYPQIRNDPLTSTTLNQLSRASRVCIFDNINQSKGFASASFYSLVNQAPKVLYGVGVLKHRMILETDGNVIAGKVATRSIDEGSPLSEQA
ncbi:hypothetical protein Tco_0939981 [Tanacetum coccineum]|uniref:Uncharacterized protein n=1 Tax=Tanacetum coccineum TaxID=301880 RepID=A0ABQ5DLN4_9ASTR